MGVIRYGRTAQIGVYPGNQSGRYISYRSGGVRFPLDPDVTLAYSFAATKSLDPIRGSSVLTFTRASPAWYWNSAGVLTQAAINEPRFDHDPDTLESFGLLIEQESTNLFLNSTAPVTQDVTTAAGFHAVWMRGPGSVTLSGTMTGVVTEGNPVIANASAGALTCTVAGGATFVQVEATTAQLPTSPIVTGGTPVTRSEDSCTTTDMSFFNIGEGTFYSSARTTNPIITARQVIVGLREGGPNYYRQSFEGTGFNFLGQQSGSANYSSNVPGLPASSQLYKFGSAYDATGFSHYVDGVAGVNAGAQVAPTVNPNTLSFGEMNIAGHLQRQVHIAEFGFADVRKSDVFLQNLTS